VIEDNYQLLCGDAAAVLRTLPAASVQTVVTSPPYFRLRDYGVKGQIGLEETPRAYLMRLVETFAEVWPVLRDTGTLWVNMGDSFGKRKQLHLMPHRFALAMQEAGWICRQDIVWHKGNAFPESVRDRCTRAHESLFMFVKQEKYFYDADAIREPAAHFRPCGPKSRADNDRDPAHGTRKQDAVGKRTYTGFNERWKNKPVEGRNRRDVWTIGTSPYQGWGDVDHFATFPPALVEPCVLAGSAPGDLVLHGLGHHPGGGARPRSPRHRYRYSFYLPSTRSAAY
jgi:site-specific DNA-methyltransferase (adenine-specific)